MNFVERLASLAPLILTAGIGCSQGTNDTKSSGGAPGTGGSAGQAAGATGGTGGSGGSSGSATTGGTGGSTGGAGGSSGTGTGGTSGKGSAGAGAGGTGAGGAGAGGTGAGGMATGGTGAGGMGTGGMGGSGIDADSFFSPNMNGLYYELRTYNGTDPGGGLYWLTESDTDMCPTGADWATSGLTPNPKMFMAKGTAGQKYTVNFQVRGAMAARCVSGGTPSAMTADAMGTKNNLFYVGGTQFMDSPINTWQLDVAPMGEAATYFLNGIPSTSGQCDAKITYDVGYTAKMVVMGDSTVTLSAHSSDCKVPQNCGAMGTTSCMPRTIDMTGVEVHASPMQPVADIFDMTTVYPQWVVIDILSITQN
jgi:hypothetical protein